MVLISSYLNVKNNINASAKGYIYFIEDIEEGT
jgi:hypothetical protein